MSSNGVSEKGQSHISCTCLTFLYCAFANVSANDLDGKRHSHIGCICFTFLHCVNEMQTVWRCLFSDKAFENTFENVQRRKVKQMQPMWLRFFSDKQLEDTFKNTQWGKIKQMQFQSYYSLLLTPERLLSWMDEHVVLEVGGQGLFLNFTKEITFWYRVASYTKCILMLSLIHIWRCRRRG